MMRITIFPPDGVVWVDGVFRKVDLSDLDPAIQAVQFDDVAGVGHIEYRRTAMVAVEARDVDAERAAELAVGNDRARQAQLRAIPKTIQVPRGNEAIGIDSFAPYQKYIARWNQADA